MSMVKSLIGAVRGRPGADGSDTTPAPDAALLYDRHTRATQANEAARGAAQGAEAMIAHQRAALTAAGDETRLLAGHESDLKAAADRVREALERARLVALNAGLEGARLGEPVGGALVAVGEEVRGHVARALDALTDQLTLLSQLEHEHGRLREQVDQARRRAGELGEQLAGATAAQTRVAAALEELGTLLQRATGTDPETARVVAAAAGHARALLEALSALPPDAEAGGLEQVLRPSLEPLLQQLTRFGRGRPGRGVDR